MAAGPRRALNPAVRVPLERQTQLLRLVRRGIVGPVSAWYRRIDAYQQVCALGSVGAGLTLRSPVAIRNPAAVALATGVSINAGFSSKGVGALEVERFVHFGEDVSVITDNHRYEGADLLPYDRERIIRPVQIGEACWIGDGAVLLPGATLGAGCVVGAGAVVAGSFPDGSVIGGSPARVVKQRDLHHLEQLRTEGRFFGSTAKSVFIDGYAFPLPAR